MTHEWHQTRECIPVTLLVHSRCNNADQVHNLFQFNRSRGIIKIIKR